jgi:hypothetical protein
MYLLVLKETLAQGNMQKNALRLELE